MYVGRISSRGRILPLITLMFLHSPESCLAASHLSLRLPLSEQISLSTGKKLCFFSPWLRHERSAIDPRVVSPSLD